MSGRAPAESFADRVTRWTRQHGRRDLPWQGTRDPYRIWVSEIMLQQTQVVAVIPYYTRFVERFPDVRALATAPAADVMAAWAGLGYYSRARNLHACAQAVVTRHGGAFPRSAEALAALPGIGRSTAAAWACCLGYSLSSNGKHAAYGARTTKSALSLTTLTPSFSSNSIRSQKMQRSCAS